MIIPFIGQDLFEVNPNYTIVEQSNTFLVIDNFYKNYDEIFNVLNNIPAPAWKYTSRDTKNFVDYYDCRPTIDIRFSNGYQHIDEIHRLIFGKWNSDTAQIETKPYEFNYFKVINSNVNETHQMFPHVDYDYTAIIYLDKIGNGGTAFYDIDEIPNNENENLLVDVSSYTKTIIESKPNRMLIFKGETPHGGYIRNYDAYSTDWRINQAIFFKKSLFTIDNDK